MGLLFQPRWSGDRPRHAAPLAGDDMPSDRGTVFLAALEAVVLGDASRFADLFTEDIVFTSPHLIAESLPSVQHELGTPEDSLTDLDIVVLALDVIGDKVIAEWRLEANFTGPVLYDDRLLIEPTGTAVRPPRSLRRRVPRPPDPRLPPLLRRQRAAGGRPRHPHPPQMAPRLLNAAQIIHIA